MSTSDKIDATIITVICGTMALAALRWWMRSVPAEPADGRFAGGKPSDAEMWRP